MTIRAHCTDGSDVTEVADKTEWAAYKTGAARQCKTMVVGFFAGDSGDHSGVGTLLARLSAEYPETWFYSIDVSSDAAQVWRDSSLVEAIFTPTAGEVEDLLEKHGARF